MKFNEELGRKVRDESWTELSVSTYQRITEALESGCKETALELIDYFLDEALVCRRLFDQWIRDTQKFLLFKGYGEERLEALNREIRTVIDFDRQRASWDREQGWQTFLEIKETLGQKLKLDEVGLPEYLAQMKESWRISHDLDVDYLLGLFDAVMTEYGEETIQEMYEEHIIKDWFEKRYKRFDVSKHDWKNTYPLLTFLSFEAMHGHLCGEGREGDVEFEEFSDRIELQFDPCGSGGRAYRGSPEDDTGSRMESPYRYRAIEGAYDFTWNKKGVCTYCAHCCVLTEKRPAEEFGYPVRIIEPPSYPENRDAKCKYIIYKDPRDIPEHYYRRLGLEKPASDQPLGSDHGPFKRNLNSIAAKVID
jgi:hypothetical protein